MWDIDELHMRQIKVSFLRRLHIFSSSKRSLPYKSRAKCCFWSKFTIVLTCTIYLPTLEVARGE